MTETSKIILMTASGMRTMADLSPRLTLDGSPSDLTAVSQIVGMRGVSIAVMAYKEGADTPVAPEPEPAKGGLCAKWLGMRCGDANFQVWLFETHGDLMMMLPDGIDSKEGVEVMVRFLCCVQSRAEIDNSDRAQQLFQSRIRGPWAKHTGAAT
jgi:hypothetical protein